MFGCHFSSLGDFRRLIPDNSFINSTVAPVIITQLDIPQWIQRLPAPCVCTHIVNAALRFPTQFALSFARVGVADWHITRPAFYKLVEFLPTACSKAATICSTLVPRQYPGYM
jgi:hypothetical protein